VTRELEQKGLIRHRRWLEFYSGLRGFDRRIKRGTYSFAGRLRPVDILRKLVAGEVMTVRVTVPEGFTVKQIASLLARTAGVDSAAFDSLASQPSLARAYGFDAPGLEGFLFPDTYLVPWGAGPREVIEAMVHRFEEVFSDTLERRARELGMSREEAVTLASIVEAEARLPRERSLISAVYHNRLRRRMKLEADPTVAYALGGKRELTRKDLAVDSPYNTYLHRGLPPGPICSPGEASLRAALYPDSTSRALYFVARGDGGHIFSNTLTEHLSAVRKARARRRKPRKEGSR